MKTTTGILNKTSPQYRGLVACWDARSGSPSALRNMVTREIASRTGSPTIAGSERGLALSVTAGFQYWDAPFVAQNSLGNMLSWSYWGKSSATSYQHAMSRDVVGSRSWKVGVQNGQMWLVVFSPAGTKYRINTTVPYADGRWHHFAHTFNGNASGQITAYFDGVKVDQVNTDFAGIYDTTINVKIGAWGYNTGYVWNGLLADLRIYKVCKSQGEILAIFQKPGDLYKASRASYALARLVSPALRWWHGA